MDSERAPLTDAHSHQRDDYEDADELEQIRFVLSLAATVRSRAKESST